MRNILTFLLSMISIVAIGQSNNCGSDSTLTVGTSCSPTEYKITNSFSGSGQSTNCGNGNNNGKKNGWYTFTANGTNTVLEASCANGNNIILTVFSGGCGSLSQVGCVDESGNGGTETLSITTVNGTQYWIQILNQSNSEVNGNICIYLDCTVLPIELSEFNGFNDGMNNKLNWKTASESNNKHFTIERSNNGYDWEIINKVDGSGNSTTELNYELYDRDYKDAINYYRLSQTDFDGKSETFKIISIDNSKEPKILIKIVNLMGQEVDDENYNGIILYLYSDGTVLKKLGTIWFLPKAPRFY